MFCSLCNIHLSNDNDEKLHLAGKKHLHMADVNRRWKEENERSVYVRGFSPGASELALLDFFAKCGNVEKVYLDKKQWNYAFVVFETKLAAAEAVKMSGATMMGTRLVVRPKRHTPPRTETRKNPQRAEPVDKSTVDGTILNDLNKQDSVSQQMVKLVAEMQLSASQHATRLEICSYLNQVLSHFFPACTVHQFGSSCNGFGVKGSDLDLYLDLQSENSSQTHSEGKPLPRAALMDIASWKMVRAEKIRPEKLANHTIQQTTGLLREIVKGCLPGTRNVVAIKHARCPVVKFTYGTEAIQCDLSLNNRLAQRNTDLLYLYSVYDSRVRPLVFTVRQWAKLCNVGGCGQGARLNSYAVTLLVLFFLEVEHVVPSVQQLKELCSADESCELEGWDCSFCNCLSKLPPPECSLTSAELLAKFFNYFAMDFDFNSYVVCPRTGEPTLTSAITGAAYNSNDSFKVNQMCIQDPFLLTHNVAMNVPEKGFLHIMQEFRQAAQICQTSAFGGKTDESHGEKWGLGLLLEDSSQVQGNVMAGPSQKHQFSIIFRKQQITAEFLSRHESPEQVMRAWFSDVVSLFKMILCECLLFTCELDPSTLLSTSDQRMANRLVEADSHITNVPNAINDSISNTGNDQLIGQNTDSFGNHAAVTGSSGGADTISCNPSPAHTFESAGERLLKALHVIEDNHTDVISPPSKKRSHVDETSDTDPLLSEHKRCKHSDVPVSLPDSANHVASQSLSGNSSIAVSPPMPTQTNTEVLEPMARQTSSEVLEPMARQTSSEVLEPMATQTNTEVLEPMVRQTSSEVLEPTARQTSSEVLEPMARQTSSEVSEPTARQTSSEVLEPMVRQTSGAVSPTLQTVQSSSGNQTSSALDQVCEGATSEGCIGEDREYTEQNKDERDSIQDKINTDNGAIKDNRGAGQDNRGRGDDKEDLGVFIFEATHHTWHQRKKTKQKVLWDFQDPYGQEKEVSRLIIAMDSVPVSKRPLVRFSVKFVKSLEVNSPSAMLQFQPLCNEKEFGLVFSFLKSYVCKLISKHDFV
ncbi:PREDICTED: speckle targeted PIP5K1A-regulated poly(A) polymerase-like isoform X2 [Priapulus caudatus]|uniref:Speckle targeted PIP5K1A-regulated poly(A) polymerase n=1 Tax=Priapulus caudatus TaxID=37621 RepID=A0ABM1F9Z8_PRICU|nr:PREDICTED: speckle targeted PIP5K1A-regulated poly(A) polymerase-like isoform X2 [Priapulus caudatus]